jgi:hypothetical protein
MPLPPVVAKEATLPKCKTPLTNTTSTMPPSTKLGTTSNIDDAWKDHHATAAHTCTSYKYTSELQIYSSIFIETKNFTTVELCELLIKNIPNSEPCAINLTKFDKNALNKNMKLAVSTILGPFGVSAMIFFLGCLV